MTRQTGLRYLGGIQKILMGKRISRSPKFNNRCIYLKSDIEFDFILDRRLNYIKEQKYIRLRGNKWLIVLKYGHIF